MKFEGTQVNIPIKGIMRAGTDNLCADGAMNEVVGMEYKDGSWLPYAVKTESDRLQFRRQTFVKTYIHKITDSTSNTLYLDSQRNLYLPVDDDGSRVPGDPIVTAVRDVAFVGNVMCVATDRGLEYYICEATDEGSTYYPIQTGYYPHVDLRVTHGLYEKELPVDVDGDLIGVRHVSRIMGEKLGFTGSSYDVIFKKTIISDNTKKSKILGGITAAYGEVRDRGGLTGYVVACVAYRNKNGDIIATDAPVLLSKPQSALSGIMKNLGTNDGKFYYREYTDEGLVTIPVEDSEILNGPIFQEPLQKEIEWERESSDMTDEGFERLYKNDFYNDTPGGSFAGKDEPTHYENYGDYKRHLWRSQRVVDLEAAPTSDLNNIHIWRYNRDNPQTSLPLPYPLFCTMEDSAMRGGDGITGMMQRDYTFYSYAVANTLQYRIPHFTKEMRSELYSICIYISPEIPAYLFSDKIDSVMDTVLATKPAVLWVYSGQAPDLQQRNHSCLGTTYYAKARDAKNIIEDIKNIKSLYLVDEIYVDEITPSNDWISVDLKGLLGDNLLTREALPITAFNRDKYYPNMLDTYNLRLHMFDYTTELFEGYGFPSFRYYEGEYQHKEKLLVGGTKWEIMVTIEDGNGETSVVTYEGIKPSFIYSMSPILTYPNKYAKSIKIRLYNYRSGGADSYEAEFNFSYHEGLGIAYYIDPDLKPIIPQIMQQAIEES